MFLPDRILVMSGKRKCGKDFLAARLQSEIGANNCELIHISRPIKEYWARENGLDLAQLLSDCAYKETYRQQMIEWSERIRADDPDYFCRLACKDVTAKIWIVVDVRRRTDIAFFYRNFAKHIIRTVRVNASESTRSKRGWIYTEGIDNKETECDLDDYVDWDYRLENNDGDYDNNLQQLIVFLRT